MSPQPGALPIWTLNGRPSASADAARLAELDRLRKLTAEERVRRALLLGIESQRLRAARDVGVAPR